MFGSQSFLGRGEGRLKKDSRPLLNVEAVVLFQDLTLLGRHVRRNSDFYNDIQIPVALGIKPGHAPAVKPEGRSALRAGWNGNQKGFSA